MAAEGRARLRLESGPMAVRTWTALSPRAQQRALEIAPGALTWTVLLIPLIVAFAIRFNDPADLWIIGLGAVLLDAYWFLRTAVTVYWVWRSLQQLRRVEAGDWWAECERMETPEGAPGPNDITHCALIPTYTERYEVLRATVEALADQRYPDQLKVCADHHPGHRHRRLRQRPPAAVRARPPIPRLHPHQGPAASRDRGGQVGGDVVRRPGAPPALRTAGAGPGAHPGHRPRLRFPPAPSVLRPHHLELPARRPSPHLDLAAGAGLPQQPLEGAGRGQGDGDRRHPVADVPSPAPGSAGDVLLLHHVDEAADRGRATGTATSSPRTRVSSGRRSSAMARTSRCDPHSCPCSATPPGRATTPPPT